MRDESAPEPCPLCSDSGATAFAEDRLREYWRCGECGLVFVPSTYLLSPDEEKKRYDFHQNSPDDAGYREFLNRLCAPLLDRIGPGGRGLDFGCGPGPTLSVMLEEAGHEVALYDPFYANDESVFQRDYDFVTASEVVEHLRRPLHEFERLWALLRVGGWLGIMTKLLPGDDAFLGWRYKDDDTHIRFYAESTFEWLASLLGARRERVGADVVLLQKLR